MYLFLTREVNHAWNAIKLGGKYITRLGHRARVVRENKSAALSALQKLKAKRRGDMPATSAGSERKTG